MVTKVTEEIVRMRKDSGIAPNLLKKRTEASKKARVEGLKQKKVRFAGLAAMELTTEQEKVRVESEAKMAKVRVEIGKLLSDEQ